MSDQENSAADDEFIDDEWSDAVDDTPDETAASDDEFGDWGGDELQSAYLKALSALDAVEAEIPVAAPARSRDSDDLSDDETDVADAEIKSDESDSAEVKAVTTTEASRALSEPDSVSPTDQAALSELMSESLDVGSTKPNEPAVVAAAPEGARPTPRQIIEACLFVGGTPLAASRLATVLRGEFDAEYIDREVDELNRLYAAESRPYEIRLGDGGYRLALREEFERIRHRVYGLGPKEVRLSQEALEVLSVVAYHQPIKQATVEELGKSNCGAVLRQLVRRELLSVERDPAQPRDVNYKTTPRFLSLFNIKSLDELPRHEQVTYK